MFSRENNQTILKIKNAKFSWYCFYMNANIYGDFQICISVPLSYSSDSVVNYGCCFLRGNI